MRAANTLCFIVLALSVVITQEARADDRLHCTQKDQQRTLGKLLGTGAPSEFDLIISESAQTFTIIQPGEQPEVHRSSPPQTIKVNPDSGIPVKTEDGAPGYIVSKETVKISRDAASYSDVSQMHYSYSGKATGQPLSVGMSLDRNTGKLDFTTDNTGLNAGIALFGGDFSCVGGGTPRKAPALPATVGNPEMPAASSPPKARGDESKAAAKPTTLQTPRDALPAAGGGQALVQSAAAQPPPPPPPVDVRETLMSILRRYESNRLYVAPNISAQIKQNALSHAAGLVDDTDILAIADDTVMHNGNNGVYFFKTGILNVQGSLKPNFYRYANLKGITATKGTFVIRFGQAEITAISVGKDTMIEIMNQLIAAAH
ncbi:MAG TPA: hypothetical protein VG942_05365 [Hyphomonadaceae bacterium]|nr:hypothetical protein [Hyphomonadaceae bacterium]